MLISSTKHSKGFTIIEAMIALLIFSFGLLALAGLQAAMLKSTTDNKFRVDASFIAQERLGMMQVDLPNLTEYVETDTPLPSSQLPNGKRTTTFANLNRGLVTVKVTWKAPGSTTHKYEASTYINGNDN